MIFVAGLDVVLKTFHSVSIARHRRRRLRSTLGAVFPVHRPALSRWTPCSLSSSTRGALRSKTSGTPLSQGPGAIWTFVKDEVLSVVFCQQRAFNLMQLSNGISLSHRVYVCMYACIVTNLYSAVL